MDENIKESVNDQVFADINPESSEWSMSSDFSDDGVNFLGESDEDLSIPHTKNEIVPEYHQISGHCETDMVFGDILGQIPYSIVPDNEDIYKLGNLKGACREKYFVISHTASCKALMPGSIVSARDKTVLGIIFDVFGPVQSPFYSILKAPNAILDSNDNELYYVVQRSTFIDTKNINTKGSDASNQFDEEPNESELEYSDDEQERLAKQKRRTKSAPKVSSVDYEPLVRPTITNNKAT